MGYNIISLVPRITPATLEKYARVVGQLPWFDPNEYFVPAVTARCEPSHISVGRFIDFVRTAMEETRRQTGTYPAWLTEHDLRTYFKADGIVIRSGRPFVFGDKKDQRDYNA